LRRSGLNGKADLLSFLLLCTALLASACVSEPEIIQDEHAGMPKVEGLEATQGLSERTIEITWDAGEYPVVLYRASESAGPYMMHLSPSRSLYFSDIAVMPDTVYWYKAAYFDPSTWEEGPFTEPVKGATAAESQEKSIPRIPADGSWNTYSIEPGISQWFYIDIPDPGAYTMWIDDLSGSGRSSVDLLTEVYAQDRTTSYFSEPRDEAYRIPLYIQIPEGQMQLYLSVKAKGETAGEASFRFARTPVMQDDGQWFEIDSVSSSGLWVLLDTQPDRMIDLFWDDASEGSGRYTADIDMYAFSLDGSQFFAKAPDGCSNPFTIRTKNTDSRVLLFAEFVGGGEGKAALRAEPAPSWGILEILIDESANLFEKFDYLDIAVNGDVLGMIEPGVNSKLFDYDGVLETVRVSHEDSSFTLYVEEDVRTVLITDTDGSFTIIPNE
jgi:hypothetical protein